MQLTGATYLIKLDLQDVYYQLRIRKDNKWKTAFHTQYRYFEYTVMPFGLANTSAFFQIYINKAMAGLLNVICVVYLNNILIYTFNKNSEMHWAAVCKMFQQIQNFKFFVKLKKCNFITTKVDFLSFIVSTVGVMMDLSRINTVTD